MDEIRGSWRMEDQERAAADRESAASSRQVSHVFGDVMGALLILMFFARHEEHETLLRQEAAARQARNGRSKESGWQLARAGPPPQDEFWPPCRTGARR